MNETVAEMHDIKLQQLKVIESWKFFTVHMWKTEYISQW